MTRTRVVGLLLIAAAASTPWRGAVAQSVGTGEIAFDNELIELTMPVLDGLINGLQTEIALYKAFRGELAKYPTRQAYDACQMQAAQSEAVQKLALSLTIPDNASPEEARRIITAHSERSVALFKKMCPLDPDEWTSARKAERLKAILQQAAAAAGPVGASPGGWEFARAGFAGPSASDDPAPMDGISVAAYNLEKERTAAYCAYVKAKGPPPVLSGKTLRIPGDNTDAKRNIWWIFTPNEILAMDHKCQLLNPLFQQISIYDPAGTGP